MDNVLDAVLDIDERIEGVVDGSEEGADEGDIEWSDGEVDDGDEWIVGEDEAVTAVSEWSMASLFRAILEKRWLLAISFGS